MMFKHKPDIDEVELVERTVSDGSISILEKGQVLDKYSRSRPATLEQTSWRLLSTLVTMSFLWIGSQIPLFLFGSVIPLMYQDIGGVDRWVWFIIAYLIPVAALCPFVGALSDLFGRQKVAILGQCLLILGPVVTATAQSMNIAIAGQVFSGLGAGLNELIALAGTAEVVPVKQRGKYVALVVMSILPFCPSTLYAQLIARSSNWRYVGILVGLWNVVGLFLCMFAYRDPPKPASGYSARDVLKQVDYIGGFLSTAGITCFMMGLQWSTTQYKASSAHTVAPLTVGLICMTAFVVWEFFAPYPMVPRALFQKSKRNMIVVLLITCLSGGNFFALLLFWPTETFNVYGDNPLDIGIRSLPIGFGIIGGAVLCLVLISLTQGRTKLLMIFFSILMTAGTGAMSAATPSNINTVYFIVTLAAVGVGGVIIPCSIIAQIACPDELIATVTAITLSIRYIGGAVGFAIYAKLFHYKLTGYMTTEVAIKTIVRQVIVSPRNVTAVTEMTRLVANAEFKQLKHMLATNPAVLNRDALPVIVQASQKAFAQAYRYPYWISIVFGGICILLSCFLGDIRDLMTEEGAREERVNKARR